MSERMSEEEFADALTNLPYGDCTAREKEILAHYAALRTSETALSARVKALEEALREIAGSSLVCANPAEYLQAVARRALRPTHDTGEGE